MNTPSESSSPLARRTFLSQAIAVSGAAVATGLAVTPLAAAQNKALKADQKDAPTRVLIEAETGATFEATLVPGTLAEVSDPKLGRILRMELTFDTFTDRPTHVRKVTEQVAALASVNADYHRPPLVMMRFSGGGGGGVAGTVLSTVTGYSLFLDDGTPVRAIMNVAFGVS